MNKGALGNLLVNVRYANGASPVENGKVILKKSEVVLGEYSTDMDGKTPLISLAVGNDYSVSVFAEGFWKKEYLEIPIVRNITTIQNVNMFPYVSEGVETGNEG